MIKLMVGLTCALITRLMEDHAACWLPVSSSFDRMKRLR